MVSSDRACRPPADPGRFAPAVRPASAVGPREFSARNRSPTGRRGAVGGGGRDKTKPIFPIMRIHKVLSEINFRRIPRGGLRKTKPIRRRPRRDAAVRRVRGGPKPPARLVRFPDRTHRPLKFALPGGCVRGSRPHPEDFDGARACATHRQDDRVFHTPDPISDDGLTPGPPPHVRAGSNPRAIRIAPGVTRDRAAGDHSSSGRDLANSPDGNAANLEDRFGAAGEPRRLEDQQAERRSGGRAGLGVAVGAAEAPA